MLMIDVSKEVLIGDITSRNTGYRSYLSRMSEVPLVISFYTENSPYQLEALNLISSCQELGIEAEIVGVPSQGTWERNCALKPFFIREKLLEKSGPCSGSTPMRSLKKNPISHF